MQAALERAGVRSVLLKGPAFGRLLYHDARSRDYADVDLLVDPARLESAEKVLRALDFHRVDPEAAVRQTDASVGGAVGVQGASVPRRGSRERQFVIDLHDNLPQCGAHADLVWRALGEHLVVEEIAGSPTATLDRPASALLVALHAAHHGPGWDPGARDLAAAVEMFDLDCWREARALASTLEAEVALGAGLGTSESGASSPGGFRCRASRARRAACSGPALLGARAY